MEPRAFDRIARLLGSATSRRAGLATALGAAFGVVAGRAADATRRDPKPEGPCGPSGANNRCTKDKQCCTGYCKKGKKGRPGRCRCIVMGNPCGPGQQCCTDGACVDGVCKHVLPPVATGQPCRRKDTCADAAATCQRYDSDDPGGTYCVLPVGAACSGNRDCYSQDCSGGICAAVACTVCASGCPFSDLASAIASPPPDGRIKLAPGTWTNTGASFDIPQSMQIEACGGEPGVIVLPSLYFVFNVTGGVTLTVKNIEFGYVYQTTALGTAGSSAQAMATLNVNGCTFQGGPESFSLSPSSYTTATLTNCTFNSAPVSSLGNAVGDPSSMTFKNCTFTGEILGPVISIGGNIDVSLTGCAVSGGTGGGILYTQSGSATTATVTLADTVVSGNSESLVGGGGLGAFVEDGATVTVALGDGVSITGNTAPAGRGSGILGWAMNGSVVTITGAPGKVSGNTPDPQCAMYDGSTWTPVANCAY